jgi:hypothetical protein
MDFELELTRRQVLAAGVAALVAQALPVARAQQPPGPTACGGVCPVTDPSYADGLLQAYADTLIPGRKVNVTESGAPVHPLAILGSDPRPGAVECDALAIYHDPRIGFDALAPAFLADLTLNARGDFLSQDLAGRTATCTRGLDFGNPLRLLWEAAAAVPFVAIAATRTGTTMMGYPGAAPHGYRDFSYRRKLARERTRRGSLA